MSPRFYASLLLLCGVFPVAGLAQSPGGAMIGNTCAGCHGTQGAPANTKIPPLAGMDIQQFIDAMHAYRDDRRRGSIMNRVAKAYTDEEIAALAAYFASFPKDTSD